MPGVTGVPGVPSAEELSALPAAELAVRLAEAYRLIAELTAQIERLVGPGGGAGAAGPQGLVHVVASPFLR